MIGYLYFIQGVILSIPSSMPYVYPSLPDYRTLSMFSLVALPFSLKFLTAPMLEKYSNISYGKRKFWIVISQIISSISIFVASFFTDLTDAPTLVFLSFISIFALTLQDISLDALSLK